MIEGLKPYPAYMETGLPWVGIYPNHWAIKRGKALFAESYLPVRAEDGIVTCFRDGQVTLRKNRRTSGFMEALYEIGYQGVRRGHLVIHAMDAFAGAVGVSDSDGKCTPEYIVADPRSGEAVPRYFALLVRFAAHQGFILVSCPAVRERAPRFRYSHFGDMLMPVPPKEEQEAIVRFLAHANQKIDGFIRAKRKLIGLLNEQKQAIIHQAVTRGLDPSVPLKPSGIPWLGDIPKHWEVRRLKTLVYRIEQGISPQASGFLAEGDSWGVLKSGCVNHGVFRQTEHKQLAKGFTVDPAIVVKVGDVLISRACGSPKLVGSVGKVQFLHYKLILSDKTFRAVFRPIVNADFMVYAMNGSDYRQQVEQAISGAEGMANNLPLSELRSFIFAVPPFDEAKTIASALDGELAQFNTAITRTEREIALMQEYRTRLTADLVTGKLDVREAASKLPELADQPTVEEAIDANEADLQDEP